MKQNYILIMCDDLGFGDVGFNGNKIIQTPNLDQMAGEGAVFRNFYAGAPVCSPTRATCLTGRHCYRMGVFHANEGVLPKEEITIQQLLKQKGYVTGHFGKWHLGTLSKTIKDGRRGGSEHPELYAPPWERDFDECFSTEVAVPLYNPYENQPFSSKYWMGEELYETENVSGDDSRVIMDRAIPFIEKAHKSGTPFFCVIWFHAPHTKVVAGPEYRELYKEYPENMQHYFGCITAMDEQVGRLNNKLKELQLEDNTCVFFCSDNGPEGNGDTDSTRFCGSTGGLRGRKRSLFNGGICVPAFVKWKKYVQPGNTYDFLASTLDYLPTIIADAGCEMPDNRPIDGIDLKKYLLNNMNKREKPIPFRFVEKKSSLFGSPTYALVTEDYKILYNPGNYDEECMMFKTKQDKREEYNIKSVHQEIFDEYREYSMDVAKSFEESHRGMDYPERQEFKPVNEYISNEQSWYL